MADQAPPSRRIYVSAQLFPSVAGNGINRWCRWLEFLRTTPGNGSSQRTEYGNALQIALFACGRGKKTKGHGALCLPRGPWFWIRLSPAYPSHREEAGRRLRKVIPKAEDQCPPVQHDRSPVSRWEVFTILPGKASRLFLAYSFHSIRLGSPTQWVPRQWLFARRIG